MKIKSLDPRINREEIIAEKQFEEETSGMQWPTFEVFHQDKRGAQHVHVGIVHATNPELALVFAKEQYGRRGSSVNIWVVPTDQVTASSYDDSDIFDSAPEKRYREAWDYKVMGRIKAYKEKNNIK